MNCYKGNFSLVDNCWNELTKSFERAPCQPTICQEIPDSDPGEGQSLPDWGLALIICSVVAIFGVFTYFLIKKKVLKSVQFRSGRCFGCLNESSNA